MPKPSTKVPPIGTRPPWDADSKRPEDELLLCCSRTCMDSENAERIRSLLREDIDWGYLIRQANLHGMIPLLYWNLNSICPEAAPKPTLDELRTHFDANALRNRFLTGELLKLLNQLKDRAIPALPFKGPILAVSVYGNLALRPFGDLDILIQKQDFPKAKNLLISQGYRPWPQRTDAQEAKHLRYHYAYGLERGDRRIFVELHWRITWRYFPFPINFERLWERRERISFADTTVFSLPPEDLLLILCVHGSKHCWERLTWICDVAELIRTHQAMNWERIIAQASRLDSRRMLFLGLLLADDLLGTLLPEEVLRKSRTDPVVKSLAADICERLFRETNGSRPEVKAASFSLLKGRDIFHLKMRERLRNRVPLYLHRFHQAMTPTERDRALLPLPTALSFLYYLVHAIRLIGTYGLHPLRRFLQQSPSDH